MAQGNENESIIIKRISNHNKLKNKIKQEE